MDRYQPIRPFGVAFAREYKGYMTSRGIKQSDIAALLGRNAGYVSERANGKRALDTDDVDALAELTGTNGRDLMIELAQRARGLSVVPPLEDEEPTVSAPPVSMPAAAKRGRRKADDVGEAE